jgi:hypothetical protein
MSFINSSMVQATAEFLFGDKEINEKDFESLRKYMENQYRAIQCCVLYKHSEEFRGWLARHPNLPDIGEKEVIVREGARVIDSRRSGTAPERTIWREELDWKEKNRRPMGTSFF